MNCLENWSILKLCSLIWTFLYPLHAQATWKKGHQEVKIAVKEILLNKWSIRKLSFFVLLFGPSYTGCMLSKLEQRPPGSQNSREWIALKNWSILKLLSSYLDFLVSVACSMQLEKMPPWSQNSEWILLENDQFGNFHSLSSFLRWWRVFRADDFKSSRKNQKNRKKSRKSQN